MKTRDLVLGGGGPVGLAWETGMIAGLAQAGIDLSTADRVFGTSAGSLLGARLRLSEGLADLAASLLAPRPAAPDALPPPPASPGGLMQVIADAHGSGRDPVAVRRDFGRKALDAETMGSEAAFALVEQFLGAPKGQAWPEAYLACTAVDADSGVFRILDRASGGDLVASVAASCAVPGLFPPAVIQGRSYIDGGFRSFTNADLATGHDIVVVIAIQTAQAPAYITGQMEREVAGLRADGATVVLITPDAAAEAAMGPNLLDFARQPDAARAGIAQAAREAAAVASAWN